MAAEVSCLFFFNGREFTVWTYDSVSSLVRHKPRKHFNIRKELI